MNTIELLFKLPLRDLINKFPEVGKLLHEYGINCIPCTKENCHIKDVFDHHQIPGSQEQDFLDKMKAIITPDDDVFMDPQKKESTRQVYSAPIQELIKEHDHIRLILDIIPAIIGNINNPYDNVSEDIVDVIELIENYADKIHHAKEEDILFKYFDEENAMIQAMYMDHQEGRAYRLGIQKGLINNHKETIAGNLLKYQTLLNEHITQEDEILFPWIEGNLTSNQVTELAGKFYNADRLNGTTTRNYIGLINRLVAKYKKIANKNPSAMGLVTVNLQDISV